VHEIARAGRRDPQGLGRALYGVGPPGLDRARVRDGDVEQHIQRERRAPRPGGRSDPPWPQRRAIDFREEALNEAAECRLPHHLLDVLMDRDPPDEPRGNPAPRDGEGGCVPGPRDGQPHSSPACRLPRHRGSPSGRRQV